MIGIWNQYLHIYLYVLSIGMLIGFGLPLLFVPLYWARLFRWEIPQQADSATHLWGNKEGSTHHGNRRNPGVVSLALCHLSLLSYIIRMDLRYFSIQ
jgi:hypothetical protein